MRKRRTSQRESTRSPGNIGDAWPGSHGEWTAVVTRPTVEGVSGCELEIEVPRGAWYSGSVGGEQPSEATQLTFVNRRAIVRVPHGACVLRVVVEGPAGAPWELHVVPRHLGTSLPGITRKGRLGRERIVATRLAVSA